jgi:uncharacterized protein (TIGR02145 family)
MKRFSEIMMKKIPVFLCGILAVLFCACGDDSDSSHDVEEDSPSVEENSSSSVSGGKGSSSSSIEAIVDVKEGSVVEADSIDLIEYAEEGSVVDKRNKKAYDLLVSGILVWTNENIDLKTTRPMSACYDYSDSLCAKYGRLYSNAEQSLCPDGFRLPLAGEYRLLLEYKEDYKKQFAGSCKTQDDAPIVCSDLDSMAYYITKDDSVVSISKKGSLDVFKNDSRLGSVRCVREKPIVDKYRDLPQCVSTYRGRMVYAIDKDSAYTCDGDVWEYAGKTSVCSDGEKYVSTGKTEELYACTDGKWHKATLDDIDKPCIDENRHKNVVFNGNRYACSKTGWVELEYPASELGECYSEIFGTVAKSDSNKTYVCKNSGKWVVAGPADVYGRCTRKLNGSIVTLDSVQWYCNTIVYKYNEEFDWVSNKGNINEKFGFCTDEHLKDTVIYNDSYYTCGENHEWKKENDTSILPLCNSFSKNVVYDSTVYIGHKEYWCNVMTKSWQLIEHKLFDDQTDSVSCNMKNYGKMYSLNGVKYICSVKSNELEFREATDVELKYGACGLDTVYAITEDGTYYSCKQGYWSNRKLGVCEAKFGLCVKEKDRTELYADSGCFCSDGTWENRKLHIVEQKYEVCETGKNFVLFYGDTTYTCRGSYLSTFPIMSNDYKKVFGNCEGELHGTDTVYYGLRFVCDTTLNTTPRNNWYRYREADSLAGTYCHKAIKDSVVVLRDSSYVACNGRGTWITKDYSKYMSECNEDNEGLVEYNGVTNSVCLGGRWVPADTFHVTDKRDGKEYAAITIDGVTWMAEPLRYVPKGKTVYVERSIYPVEEVEADELVYYPWIVAMNLDEKYEKGFAKGSVIKSNTVVQGACMEGWHIPRYDEIKQKLTDKIYYRLQGFSKTYGDDDIVGIHFMTRNELAVARDTVAGIDSVSSIKKISMDYMWVVDETDDLFLRAPTRANVAVVRTGGLDYMTKIKYSPSLVRCVKDN